MFLFYQNQTKFMAFALEHWASGENCGKQNLKLTKDHAERGVKIDRWCTCSKLKINDRSHRKFREKRFQELLSLLTQNGLEMTLRDLGRSHSFKKDEVEGLVCEFPGELRIYKLKPNGSRGRPSLVVRSLEPLEMALDDEEITV